MPKMQAELLRSSHLAATHATPYLRESAVPYSLTFSTWTDSTLEPYPCDYSGCDKRFAIAGALTIHKRTHNGEKPFKCTYCERAFTESSNLSKHVRALLSSMNLMSLTYIGSFELTQAHGRIRVLSLDAARRLHDRTSSRDTELFTTKRHF